MNKAPIGYKPSYDHSKGKVKFTLKWTEEGMNMEQTAKKHLKQYVSDKIMSCILFDMNCANFPDDAKIEGIKGSVTYAGYVPEEGQQPTEYSRAPSQNKYGRHGNRVTKWIIELSHPTSNTRSVTVRKPGGSHGSMARESVMLLEGRRVVVKKGNKVVKTVDLE